MSNKARIELWAKALKSGKFKKMKYNKSSGASDGKFCALGVACSVFESSANKKLTTKEWVSHFLPKKVSNWYGITSANPSICVAVGKLKGCGKISYINDDGIYRANSWENAKVSFKAIAKGIEDKYL